MKYIAILHGSSKHWDVDRKPHCGGGGGGSEGISANAQAYYDMMAESGKWMLDQGKANIPAALQGYQSAVDQYGGAASQADLYSTQAQQNLLQSGRSGITDQQGNLINQLNTTEIDRMQREWGQMADEASVNAMRESGKQREIAQRNLLSMGINPNSGKFAATMQQQDLANAAMAASAKNQINIAGRSAVDNAKLSGIQRSYDHMNTSYGRAGEEMARQQDLFNQRELMKQKQLAGKQDLYSNMMGMQSNASSTIGTAASGMGSLAGNLAQANAQQMAGYGQAVGSVGSAMLENSGAVKDAAQWVGNKASDIWNSFKDGGKINGLALGGSSNSLIKYGAKAQGLMPQPDKSLPPPQMPVKPYQEPMASKVVSTGKNLARVSNVVPGAKGQIMESIGNTMGSETMAAKGVGLQNAAAGQGTELVQAAQAYADAGMKDIAASLIEGGTGAGTTAASASGTSGVVAGATQDAMLAAQTLEAGAATGAAAGTAGAATGAAAGAGGITSAIGAAMPWVGAAIGIASLFGLFNTGGKVEKYAEGGSVRRKESDRVDAFDVIKEGFNDAVVKPITNDWKDAYHLQRAARVRYPGADAVLNITPYLGIATVADDIVNDLADTGSVSGENLAEAALNRAAIVGYGKKALEAVKTVRKTHKEHFPRQADSAALWTGALASVPVAAYAQHYVDKQKAANEKYGDKPLREIAKDLRGKKYAEGGAVTPEEEFSSAFNRVDMTEGGEVSGPGTTTSDDIPAWLSDGEYVLNAEAVKRIGEERLDALNQAGLKDRFAAKGGTFAEISAELLNVLPNLPHDDRSEAVLNDYRERIAAVKPAKLSPEEESLSRAVVAGIAQWLGESGDDEAGKFNWGSFFGGVADGYERTQAMIDKYRERKDQKELKAAIAADEEAMSKAGKDSWTVDDGAGAYTRYGSEAEAQSAVDELNAKILAGQQKPQAASHEIESTEIAPPPVVGGVTQANPQYAVSAQDIAKSWVEHEKGGDTKTASALRRASGDYPELSGLSTMKVTKENLPKVRAEMQKIANAPVGQVDAAASVAANAPNAGKGDAPPESKQNNTLVAKGAPRWFKVPGNTRAAQLAAIDGSNAYKVLMKQGKVAEAEKMREFYTNRANNAYLTQWGNMMSQLESGDQDGAISTAAQLFTANAPDGHYADVVKGDGGKYKVRLINSEGKVTRDFDGDAKDMIKLAYSAISPMARVNMMIEQMSEKTKPLILAENTVAIDPVTKEVIATGNPKSSSGYAAQIKDAVASGLISQKRGDELMRDNLEKQAKGSDGVNLHFGASFTERMTNPLGEREVSGLNKGKEFSHNLGMDIEAWNKAGDDASKDVEEYNVFGVGGNAVTGGAIKTKFKEMWGAHVTKTYKSNVKPTVSPQQAAISIMRAAQKAAAYDKYTELLAGMDQKDDAKAIKKLNDKARAAGIISK